MRNPEKFGQRANPLVARKPQSPAAAHEAQVEIDPYDLHEPTERYRARDTKCLRQGREARVWRNLRDPERRREPSHGRAYCSATRMGMSPCPRSSGRNAFPITAPNAFDGSVAFIA